MLCERRNLVSDVTSVRVRNPNKNGKAGGGACLHAFEGTDPGQKRKSR